MFIYHIIYFESMSDFYKIYTYNGLYRLYHEGHGEVVSTDPEEVVYLLMEVILGRLMPRVRDIPKGAELQALVEFNKINGFSVKWCDKTLTLVLTCARNSLNAHSDKLLSLSDNQANP